jgi:hypothetical protein
MDFKRIAKLGLLVAVILTGLSIGAGTASADTVTYTFTGAGEVAGTNFTYVDTAGFLTLSTTELTPTTSTNLVEGLVDQGPLLGIAFAPGALDLFTTGNSESTITVDAYTVDSDKTETLTGTPFTFDDGSLVITSTATPVPEIDPTSALAPLALLACALLILRGRRQPLPDATRRPNIC